jgi:hypothetical protein
VQQGAQDLHHQLQELQQHMQLADQEQVALHPLQEQRVQLIQVMEVMDRAEQRDQELLQWEVAPEDLV